MIQPVGQDVLGALGLAERLKARSAPIKRLHGVAAGGRVALDVNYAGCAGCPAWAGARIGARCSARSSRRWPAKASPWKPARIVRDAPLAAGDKRRLAFADGGQTVPFDLTIDALGANSPLSPKQPTPLAYGALWASLDFPTDAPFPRDALSQRYRRASVMVGVMPMGRPDGSRAASNARFSGPCGAIGSKLGRPRRWRRGKTSVRSLWPETAALLDADPLARPTDLRGLRPSHQFARRRERSRAARQFLARCEPATRAGREHGARRRAGPDFGAV